jgi:murein DD-endopeptidase MepM/ murein hydrolase activator NlpD
MFPILALMAALSMLLPTTPWEYPVRGVSMSSISKGFDPPQHVGGHGHRGVDFPAPPGTAVSAVGAGVIIFAGTISGKPTISLDHGLHPRLSKRPIRSTYEPVYSILPQGTTVSAGQLMGFTARGNSHCDQICLHLGLKVGKDSYVSPVLLWSRSPSLLPSARG